jgi:muramidase (phage lysozyme)
LPVDARRRSSIVAGKIHGIRALPAALSVLAALQNSSFLPDFSPVSQDRLAIQLIRERGARWKICSRAHRARDFPLPQYLGVIAGYGQREHSLDKLVAVWRKAGGVSA